VENREAALGEPDAVAPLDHLVAARPAGEAARRGMPVRGPRSRSCSSRRPVQLKAVADA
jgi:hypothetical protein